MLIYLFYLVFLLRSLLILDWVFVCFLGVGLLVLFIVEGYFEFNIFHFVGEYFGVDLVGAILIMLSIYIGILIVYSSFSKIEGVFGKFFILLRFIMVMCLFTIFSTSHMLLFYIFLRWFCYLFIFY